MEIHFAAPLSYLTTEICFYRKHHSKTYLGKSFSEYTWKVLPDPSPKEPITNTAAFSPRVKVQCFSCS